MLLTGFIISIPVFLDVALVILAPLLFALARDTKRPFLHFGLPLVAGLAVTHAFVPPTPGPVAVAYLLGVNLGWVILFGVMVGLPTAILCGPPLCIWLSKGVEITMPEAPPISDEQKVELPSFGFILFLIGLPIGLILANTIVEQYVASGLPVGLTKDERAEQLAAALANGSWFIQLVSFIGHPVIALLSSTIFSLYFLGTRRGVDRETLLDISTHALGPAGIIILITGAGGVFKGVLAATGITDAMEEIFSDSGISILLLAWVFATLIRVAQGSATVAMLTAAGLMGNFVEGMNQQQLALITVAIAAGATGFSHVNDSGFWMISRYFRMNEGQTLRTWGVISTMISLIGFSIAMIFWQFIGP
jgi:Gnt-I system low-affinity gluconate transporter